MPSESSKPASLAHLSRRKFQELAATESEGSEPDFEARVSNEANARGVPWESPEPLGKPRAQSPEVTASPHTRTKNPESRFRGDPIRSGEIHPLYIRICLGKTL